MAEFDRASTLTIDFNTYILPNDYLFFHGFESGCYKLLVCITKIKKEIMLNFHYSHLSETLHSIYKQFSNLGE